MQVTGISVRLAVHLLGMLCVLSACDSNDGSGAAAKAVDDGDPIGIYNEYEGLIINVHAEADDVVSKGDVIIDIACPRAEQAMQAIDREIMVRQVELKSQKSRIQQAVNATEQAQAQLTEQHQAAQSHYESKKQAFEAGNLSREELNAAASKADALRQQLERTENHLAGLSEANDSQLKHLTEILNRLNTLQACTQRDGQLIRLTAPANGRILEIRAVKSKQADTGRAIFVIQPVK